MTVNRKLKNLYSMFRFVGGQLLESWKRFENDDNGSIDYKALDNEITLLSQKYDMIKQILIER